MADAWTTVVERESEWDDATRLRVEVLDWHDDECCSGCGMHKSIVENPDDNAFTFQHRTCPMCASIAVWERIEAEQDDKALEALGKDPAPKTRRPTDGRHTHLKRLTPQEAAERKAKTGPTKRE